MTSHWMQMAAKTWRSSSMGCVWSQLSVRSMANRAGQARIWWMICRRSRRSTMLSTDFAFCGGSIGSPCQTRVFRRRWPRPAAARPDARRQRSLSDLYRQGRAAALSVIGLGWGRPRGRATYAAAMTQSLMPAELAPLIEGRFAAAMRRIADESIEVGGGVAGCSGPGSWSNQAVGLGFAGEVSREDVARVIEFHVSRGAEPKVEVAPHADPSVIQRLREARFVVNGFEQAM